MQVIFQSDRRGLVVTQCENCFVVSDKGKSYSFDSFQEAYIFCVGKSHEHTKGFTEMTKRFLEETGRVSDHESIRLLINGANRLKQVKRVKALDTGEEIMIFETEDHKYLILGENRLKLLCTLAECRAYLVSKCLVHKADYKPFKEVSQEEQKLLSITSIHSLESKKHKGTTICLLMIDGAPVYAELRSDGGYYFDTMAELTAFMFGHMEISNRRRKSLVTGK